MPQLGVYEFEQHLHDGLKRLLSSAGLVATARAVELRETEAWPPNDDARDTAAAIAALFPGPEDEDRLPRTWPDYAAMWDGAAAAVTAGDVSEAVTELADRLATATRRRFYALIMRRDERRAADLLAEALGDVGRWLAQGDPLWVSYCVNGLTVDLPREIADGIEITEDEREFCLWLWNDEFGAFITHRVEHPMTDDEARARLDCAVELLRVALVAPVRLARVISYREGIARIRSDGDIRQEYLSERGGCWLESHLLGPEDAKRVSALWKPWLSNWRQLEPAIRSFSDAVLAPSKFQTAAWATTAIEALLAPGVRDDRTGKRDILVKNRAERILSRHPSRREPVSKLIDLYRRKVRNATFHGDPEELLQAGLRDVSEEVGLPEDRAAKKILEHAGDLLVTTVAALARGETLDSYLTGVYSGS